VVRFAVRHCAQVSRLPNVQLLSFGVNFSDGAGSNRALQITAPELL